MDKVTSFFASDPMSTEVGQMIDRATNGNLDGEDWALNMEICDVINQREDGAKDAVKAIRKKLLANAGKSNNGLELTLTVTETCVKNCGPKLHAQIASKEFLDDLVKVLNPKYNPSQSVQERVLSLIQSWADAFRGKHELREVERVYQDLKSKGVEFPAADLDRMAPIYTPARSVNAPVPQPQANRSHSSSLSHPQNTAGAVTPTSNFEGTLTPQQKVKLTRDLDAIKTNCAVLSDMLVNIKPGEEPADDLQLMEELEATCREMQHRLLDLIGSGQISDEVMVSDMLKLNDDLNNAFLRYERHSRARNQARGVVSGGSPLRSPGNSSNQPPQSSSSSALQPPPPITQRAGASNLIDFGGEANGSEAESKPIDEREQLASLFSTATSISNPSQNATSGPFTSPYRSTLPPISVAGYDAAGVPSSSAGLSTAVNARVAGIDLDQLESDLNDVEQWMKQRPSDLASAQPAPAPPPRSFERNSEDANSPFGL